MASDWTGATMFHYEDFRKLIATIQEPKFMVAYLLTFFCGLRAGEICGLKKEDIDFKSKVIRLKNGKTGRRDIDIVNDKLLSLLQKWFEIIDSDEYLLTSRQINSSHLTPKSLAKQFRLDVKKASLDFEYKKRANGTTLYQYKFHSLRHAYCSIGVEFGIPAEIIQRQMGHKSIRTTIDVYTHLNKKRVHYELAKVWAQKDKIMETTQNQVDLSKKPIDILNERFAKGEVSIEEYEKRRNLLIG